MKTAVRFFLPVIFIFLFAVTVNAQHPVYIAIKGGISIPDLSGGNNHINPLENGYKSSLRGAGGLSAEFQFNKRFSIQAEINYLQEGGKNTGLQAFINPYPGLVDQPYLYANYKSEVKLDYLLFPVMARFNFPVSKKWTFYVNAGGFGAFVLSAQGLTNGKSHIYLDAAGKQEQTVYPGAEFSFNYTEDVKDSIASFNAGVILATGFSCAIGNGKIFIEAGGNYGFINLQKNSTDGTNYAGALTLQAGYAYRLKRNN